MASSSMDRSCSCPGTGTCSVKQDFHGDFMGIYRDFMVTNGDFMVINGDFMVINGDFMGINGDFMGTLW